MKTRIITAVAMSLSLLSSPSFADGSVVNPDPAGIGTYLVSAVILALGIAIFLYILIGEARANRDQERDGREATAETGAAPVLSSDARGEPAVTGRDRPELRDHPSLPARVNALP